MWHTHLPVLLNTFAKGKCRLSQVRMRMWEGLEAESIEAALSGKN